MKTLHLSLLGGLGLSLIPACSSDEDDDRDRSEKTSEAEEDDKEESDQASDRASEDLSSAGPYAGIEDPQTGIRPMSPDTLGLCRLESPDSSKKECSDFLGRDVDALPPGDYVLMARLDVPRDQKKWPVSLTTWCKKAGSEKDRKERVNDTEVSAGSKELGYRFWGLSFNVPEAAAWASDCTWTLSAPHPDGDNEFVGSWSFNPEA